jgi:2-C-methyl-D-erythritol 4-phosphate cytidylyltransferase
VYSLLLLNGGIGARAAAGQPKQFVKVKGIPILVYSLVAADPVEKITEIVLNYPPDWRDSVEEIVRDYAIKTPITYVPAGRSRHDSVRIMLEHCTNDHLIVHETARPLVSTGDFARLIESEHENTGYMIPIPFTVAPVDPEARIVVGSLERQRLRNVQLPQKYARRVLTEAHAYAAREGLQFTEDATLCVAAGFDVHFLDGDDRNLKVTSATDVRLAGFLLGSDAGDE